MEMIKSPLRKRPQKSVIQLLAVRKTAPQTEGEKMAISCRLMVDGQQRYFEKRVTTFEQIPGTLESFAKAIADCIHEAGNTRNFLVQNGIRQISDEIAILKKDCHLSTRHMASFSMNMRSHLAKNN